MNRQSPAALTCHLVLPAAGSGRRMGNALPKQYLEIAGMTLLQHSLERLGSLPEICSIVVALSAGDPWWPAVQARLSPGVRDKLRTVEGGEERCDSVRNALVSLPAAPDDFVLVHDAVRPCVRPADVQALIAALAHEEAGGLLATPVRDTLKKAAPGGQVLQTVDRAGLWQAATPQMFRFRILLAALDKMAASGRKVTDEAEAVEALGHVVKLVTGRTDNLKVTFPDDLALAALILGAQH